MSGSHRKSFLHPVCPAGSDESLEGLPQFVSRTYSGTGTIQASSGTLCGPSVIVTVRAGPQLTDPQVTDSRPGVEVPDAGLVVQR